MSDPKPVTETVVLNLRQGVTFDDVYAGRECEIGTPGHTLTDLGNRLKKAGCIRQFWGPQVENPNIFIWTIDWPSFDTHAAYINSEEYKDFMAGATQVFDFEIAAPLMMHTAFTSDATEARKTPVTEMAFFMIAKDSDEATKTKLEDSVMPVFACATNVGECSAFACGWVFEGQQHPNAPDGQVITLHGLLGWPSVESHMELRNKPEFAEAAGSMRAMVLPPIQGKSMFHVTLHPFD